MDLCMQRQGSLPLACLLQSHVRVATIFPLGTLCHQIVCSDIPLHTINLQHSSSKVHYLSILVASVSLNAPASSSSKLLDIIPHCIWTFNATNLDTFPELFFAPHEDSLCCREAVYVQSLGSNFELWRAYGHGMCYLPICATRYNFVK